MSKPRRFKKYEIGLNQDALVNVDAATRDQLLQTMHYAMHDIWSGAAYRELIAGYGIDVNDMPDEMLRELIKDQADAGDDKLKAEAK